MRGFLPQGGGKKLPVVLNLQNPAGIALKYNFNASATSKWNCIQQTCNHEWMLTWESTTHIFVIRLTILAFILPITIGAFLMRP